MGHTNSTANLALPQFIGTDKPTWLGDINSAFSDIDAYVGTNDAAVAGAVADAGSAVSQAASAVSTANAANTTAGNASTAATNAVGTANNAMSLVNQTNIKIGTLANLATTDKTSIVNAINETYGIATGNASVTVTGDGVKTYGQLMDELYAAADTSLIKAGSTLESDYNGTKSYFGLAIASGSEFTFVRSEASATATGVVYLVVKSSGSTFIRYTNNASSVTPTDNSSSVPTAGFTYTLVY